MLGKETGFFYLLYSYLGIMHILSGCFGKSAPLGNHLLLSVSGCPPTTFKKGCTVSNNSILYCICLLKNVCIATSAFSPLKTTFLIFHFSSKFRFCADWGLSSHLWYVPLTHTNMMILMIPWRHDHFFPAYNSGRVVKDSYLSTTPCQRTSYKVVNWEHKPAIYLQALTGLILTL